MTQDTKPSALEMLRDLRGRISSWGAANDLDSAIAAFEREAIAQKQLRDDVREIADRLTVEAGAGVATPGNVRKRATQLRRILDATEGA